MSPQDLTQSILESTLWQRTSIKRWLLLLIVGGILLILGFYTVTDSTRLHNDLLLQGADWSGYALCHRITERSFSVNGRQFPLCARCSGMYLGVALVFVAIALAGRLRRAGLPPLRLLLILLGFIAIMGIDGINSYSHFFPNAPHLYEPRNWLRLVTGMGTGVAMGLILLPALAQSLWKTAEYQPIISAGRELAGLLILAAVSVILLLSNRPTLLYVLAIVSVAGLLLIVTALNTVILLVIFRRDGRAVLWQQTAVPLLAGFIVTLVELSVIGLFRFNLTGTMTGFPGL
jgi:uncharacterized membrane protein